MPRASFEATLSSDELPEVKFAMSSSGVPPSLGPGARRITPGDPASSASKGPEVDSIINQVREIRSHYSVSLDDARSKLNIAYELKNRHRAFSIPFNQMPLGSTGQWLLYGGPARRLTTGIFVTDIIRGAENMAERDLTQAEAEGHACYASRRMLYSFATIASATSIGFGLAFAGRAKMKFPLRKPRPLENYNNFPSRSFPILKGQYARMTWHITRANVYTLFAFLLLSPLYSSMGDNAMTVGLYRDPRTSAVLKEMKANKDPNRAFRISRIGSNVDKSGRQDQSQMPKPFVTRSEEMTEEQRHITLGNPEEQNNYGADQGSLQRNRYDSDTEEHNFMDAQTDTGMLTDRQMQENEAKEQNSRGFSGVPAHHRSQQQPKRGELQNQQDRTSSRDDIFMLDDASPSGGRGMMDDMSAQREPVTKSGTGGAWNRVRRGEQMPHPGSKPENQSPPSKGSRSVQSSADSFSFSQNDQDRQLAKEQAQRDFDRMVEAERKGQGSEGFSGGGGSTWSSRGRGNSGSGKL